MATFAILNEDNKVVELIKVANDIETSNGPLGQNDKHPDGEKWVLNVLRKKSKQSSSSNSFRGKAAAIGDTYDAVKDIFIEPQPYPSWILNTNTGMYEAPCISPLNISTAILTEGYDTISWEESKKRWVIYDPNDTNEPSKKVPVYEWNPTTLVFDDLR
jgi:hypothetical protein